MRRPYRLMVRTTPSHGVNRGSNPRRVTKRKSAGLCGPAHFQTNLTLTHHRHIVRQGLPFAGGYIDRECVFVDRRHGAICTAHNDPVIWFKGPDLLQQCFSLGTFIPVLLRKIKTSVHPHILCVWVSPYIFYHTTTASSTLVYKDFNSCLYTGI